MKQTKKQLEEKLKKLLLKKFDDVKHQLRLLNKINSLDRSYQWIYYEDIDNTHFEKQSINFMINQINELDDLKSLKNSYNVTETYLRELDEEISMVREMINKIDKPSNQIIDKGKILSILLEEDKQDE